MAYKDGSGTSNALRAWVGLVSFLQVHTRACMITLTWQHTYLQWPLAWHIITTGFCYLHVRYYTEQEQEGVAAGQICSNTAWLLFAGWNCSCSHPDHILQALAHQQLQG